MASCEKCWTDAGGDPERYEFLRHTRWCTPEQQAGLDATRCPKCRRRTVHQYARICMVCGTDYARPRPVDATPETPETKPCS